MFDLGRDDNLSENSNSLNKSISKNSQKKSIHYNEEEDIISSSEDKINSNLEVSAEESEDEEEQEIPANVEKEKDNGYFMDNLNLLEDNGEYADNDNKLNELLFCCQEIGEFKNKELFQYEKGKYCESSLRDIHRFLSKDDPENPIYKYAILNWDIYVSDLIPLLKNYENNDKINSLCLVILCDLTELLPDIVEKRNQLNDLLFKLIKKLFQYKIIDIIARNLNNSTMKLEENKSLKAIIKKESEINNQKKKNLLNNQSSNNELIANSNIESNNLPEVNKEKINIIDDTNKVQDDINNNNKIEEDELKINQNNNNNDNENKDDIIEDDNIISTSLKNNEVTNHNELFNKEKEEEKRNLLKTIAETELKCENTTELLLVIIKQILGIFLPNNLKESTENYCAIYKLLSDYEIFDVIIYYSSYLNEKTATQDKFTNQIAPTLLQLLFYLTRLFEPKTIITLGSENYNNDNKFNVNKKQLDNLDKLIKKEELQLNQRKMNLNSRPNTFGTRIKVNRPIDNSCFIISNVNELLNNKNILINKKINNFNGQKHKKINKFNKQLIKKKNVPIEKISEEINWINDIKLRNYFNSSSNINEKDFIKVISNLKFFFNRFLENNFNSFVNYYYYQLGKEDELDKYEIYYLLNVINFFIEFNRLTNYENYNQFTAENKENHDKKYFKFNLKLIEFSINNEYIAYFYNKIFEELVNKDKKEREIYMIFPIMTYLKNILYVIFDSFKFSKASDDNDEYNFKLNVLLQDNLLTKDFSRIIKQLFTIYNEYYHPINILYELIEFTEIYYSSLEIITNKRELKIKKRGKKKVNKYDNNDEEKMIKDILNNDNNNALSDSDSESYNYVEKLIDVNSESRILVDYQIIDKLFLVFSNDSDLNKSLENIISANNNSLTKFIYRLFDRIVNKIECTWIFYNIKYFTVINDLFNNNIFNYEKNFSKIKKIFHKILDNFFTTNQINKMLPIEILFEFNNLSFIDTMLNNYENVVNQNDKLNNDIGMINEDGRDEDENYYQIGLEEDTEKKENEKNEENKWSIEDDTILINTYFNSIKQLKNDLKEDKEEEEEKNINDENIKDANNSKIKNFHNVLNLCVDSLHNKKFSIHDVKKRLKILKVKKGKEKAFKKMKKIHGIKNNKNEKKISSPTSFSFVYDLSEKIKNEEFKNKLNIVIDSILEQIEKYKNSKELASESNITLILVPSSCEEIEIFNEPSFKQLLFCHGFILNKDNLLQLNENLGLIDIDLNYDKLKKCKEIINSNINPSQIREEKEYEQKRHIHINKNKNKTNEDNDNKNEDNIDNEKHDDEENDNDKENSEYDKTKKKKKLRKEGKKSLFSIDEEDEFYESNNID